MAPQNIDPARGNPQSISCPTTSFCAAADQSGRVRQFEGTTCSDLNPQPATSSLSSISCASASFCVATTSAGYAFTYDGSV